MLGVQSKRRFLMGGVLLVTIFSFLAAYRVHAAPTPPPFTTSYYITGISTTAMYDLGCQLGRRDSSLAGTQTNVVFLFYGKPAKNTSGVFGTRILDPNSTFASVTQIRDTAQQFGRGYWACTGGDKSSQLRVAVSTSNFGSQTTREHGIAWANMVKEVHQWFINNGYSGQALAVGGNDMELGWNTPIATRAWADGYNSVANRRPYFNVGDAAGCPPLNNSNDGNACGTATYPTWTATDVRYISWSVAAASPFPQIYSNSGIHARQWQWISANVGWMDFKGALSQSAACQQNGCDGELDNTPQQAWQQLWDTLNSVQGTADSFEWLSDVSW
jgi:hypothetical protein